MTNEENILIKVKQQKDMHELFATFKIFIIKDQTSKYSLCLNKRRHKEPMTK